MNMSPHRMYHHVIFYKRQQRIFKSDIYIRKLYETYELFVYVHAWKIELNDNDILLLLWLYIFWFIYILMTQFNN